MKRGRSFAANLDSRQPYEDYYTGAGGGGGGGGGEGARRSLPFSEEEIAPSPVHHHHPHPNNTRLSDDLYLNVNQSDGCYGDGADLSNEGDYDDMHKVRNDDAISTYIVSLFFICTHTRTNTHTHMK